MNKFNHVVVRAALLAATFGALAVSGAQPAASASSSETVPPPWTPVAVQQESNGVQVAVWGRTYRFANRALPAAITTAGRELLAAPIRLVGVANGKPLEWQRGGSMLFRQSGADAVVSGWQANESLIVNTTTTIDFDGAMRVDAVVMPQRGATPKLERLWLEIPLQSRCASLYHYWPGQWGAATNSGALPAAGLALPFKPFVWLGWEEGGLGWFAESDQGWQPQGAGRTLEVAADGKETVLRLRLLDTAPLRLPITYTFGFQATPVKPMPRDFHEWRICHGASYGMEQRPSQSGAARTVLDRAVELGVKTLVFHENWTPIQNYPETTQEQELRNLVAACHRRGVKLLLYFGYEFSSLAPEWGQLADEVLTKTPAGGLTGGYHRQPEQRDYIVCYQSRWRDQLLAGIERALDRYGFDGVYLDGTIEPFACANERHGCGYRGADGKLRATYPIFAVRQLMRGLYTRIHPRGGLVNVHQSTCCLTPTLAFADSYWDGEQFEGGQLGGDPLRKLPLDAFRAEFMGRNFGVPCEFLVYEKPPAWTFDDALAVTLLHDVRVRPGSVGPALEKMSKIWTVMSRFGVGDVEWHPYWADDQLVTAEPEAVKASFYLRRGKDNAPGKALLVISNLSAQQTATAVVKLNTNLLGLRRGAARAEDALSGEKLSLEKGRLTVPLAPMRMRLVWLE